MTLTCRRRSGGPRGSWIRPNSRMFAASASTRPAAGRASSPVDVEVRKRHLFDKPSWLVSPSWWRGRGSALRSALGGAVPVCRPEMHPRISGEGRAGGRLPDRGRAGGSTGRRRPGCGPQPEARTRGGGWPLAAACRLTRGRPDAGGRQEWQSRQGGVAGVSPSILRVWPSCS